MRVGLIKKTALTYLHYHVNSGKLLNNTDYQIKTYNAKIQH